jgi:hypothetical protein
MIIGIEALQHRVGIVYFFLVIIGHIETGIASYTDGDVAFVGQQLYGLVLTPAAANIGILLFLHLYDTSRV